MATDPPLRSQDTEEAPRHVRTVCRFGSESAGLQDRFRSVFLDRIEAHAGVILPAPIDASRWRFTRYALELSSAGWSEFHVPATCVMFQYRDRLCELLALLRQPVLDSARLTGMLILSPPWRGIEGLIPCPRWMRLGPWDGTDELLVYGVGARKDLRAGHLALITPAERTTLIDALASALGAA